VRRSCSAAPSKGTPCFPRRASFSGACHIPLVCVTQGYPLLLGCDAIQPGCVQWRQAFVPPFSSRTRVPFKLMCTENGNQVGAFKLMCTENGNQVGAFTFMCTENGNQVGALTFMCTENGNKVGAFMLMCTENGNQVGAFKLMCTENGNQVGAVLCTYSPGTHTACER